MKKITIVTCSQKNKEEKKDFIENLNSTCGVEFDLFFVENNTESLSKVYNDKLLNSSTDVIVFVHDDLHFFTKGWGEKLLSLFNENKDFGIIGLAGSSEFNERCAWWTNEKKFGQVAHKKDGHVWITEFSDQFEGLEKVCMIDGIFIAIDKNKIVNGFDVDFKGFHHYDTSFCLSNFLNGVKIGVTTDIHVLHESIGGLNDTWRQNAILLINKFGKYFPITVK